MVVVTLDQDIDEVKGDYQFMRSEYNCFLENFKIKIPQVTLIMLKPSEGHISNKEITIR